MHKQLSVRTLVLFVLALILVLSGGVLAQDDSTIEPIDFSTTPVVLEFSTAAAGPPAVEPLTDGRITFRIATAGEVNGAFEGSISALVSEVTAMPSPPFHPVTVMFTIETDAGVLEGFVAGSFYREDEADYADVQATGMILSVSGAYADLYLADVFMTSEVQFVDGRSVGESGTMTIAAR